MLRIFPRRASIVAKKELQWSPLLGQFMSLSGVVWIDRGNNAKAVRSLMAAGETMKAQRMALWLFPEGTRSMREHHDMLPFKKGAFHIAVQAGVPIVPVVCENYWRLYRKNVFESGTLKVRGECCAAPSSYAMAEEPFCSSPPNTDRGVDRRGYTGPRCTRSRSDGRCAA